MTLHKSSEPTITIALDAMGGDHAPLIVVDGADLYAKKHKDVAFIFFGDEKKLTPLLQKARYLNKNAIIKHTDEAIAATEKPSSALRSGKKSSMRMAIDAVASGEAHCVVSAGNTGALMAMALFGLRPMVGIERPAIASVFPTVLPEVKTVMLDLGANIECTAENLSQFAILGAVYARDVLGIKEPRIGILNVGSEDMKGHDSVRQAHALLTAATHLPGRFLGFVEGNDISNGSVDVVVTDGFTGNITLKAIEGTAKLITHMLKQSFLANFITRLGYIFAMPALLKVKHKIDPRKYNGGPFMGLQGLCVKSHGGTDAIGFENAIAVAVQMARTDFNKRVSEALSAIDAAQKSTRHG
jgi:glycerol-3-phosphate acyltransferase PlsX